MTDTARPRPPQTPRTGAGGHGDGGADLRTTIAGLSDASTKPTGAVVGHDGPARHTSGSSLLVKTLIEALADPDS